jgi:hypothetical protein
VKLASFEAIVRALNEAGVRYVIADGLAVNAHGYLRFTKDADFVIQLIPDNIKRAFAALGILGYKPLAPVTADQFADKATREAWIREKNMQVLQLWSDRHRETSIDLFVYEPFDFDEEYANALIKPLYGSIEVRFVGIPTLIKMKEAAGRDQDRMGLLNISCRGPINVPEQIISSRERECSKKFVQPGRSHFDAQSVLSVREHGKMARTPLAAFFNIPRIDIEHLRMRLEDDAGT